MGGKQTIESVQKQFNVIYPFLKIEFFTKPHKKFEGSNKKDRYVMNEEINSIETKHTDLKIMLDHRTTVTKMEEAFEKQYGLYVQVFRKSGNVWLETSVTDNWTLDKQNAEGESLEEHFKIEKAKLNDNDS